MNMSLLTHRRRSTKCPVNFDLTHCHAEESFPGRTTKYLGVGGGRCLGWKPPNLRPFAPLKACTEPAEVVTDVKLFMTTYLVPEQPVRPALTRQVMETEMDPTVFSDLPVNGFRQMTDIFLLVP